ncbi:MAG: galactose-1-phosphate uridylyltransferase [Sedimentisphaerales bacterium]|nr:galactose-1-phosphate uridylyltransferase [Sedimentisphaerales bacterium]
MITNRWVILAPQRGGRPHDFARPDGERCPDYVSQCPFCPGNEKETPPEVFAVRPDQSGPDTPGWSVRVVPNKFPFLKFDGHSPTSQDIAGAQKAMGFHEVVIESPSHSNDLPHLEQKQICLCLGALLERYNHLAGRETVKHISLFCNHGRMAGASLLHPHFQIAASTIVSPRLDGQIEHCREYFTANGHSVFDKFIEGELKAAKRVILQNDNFISLCPAASMCPLEVYVIPRVSQPELGALNDKAIPDLADILQKILRRLDEGLNGPAYNLVFHTAPVDYDGPREAFRWYIQIYPRVGVSGGFELATDIYINSMAPTSAAQFYRGENEE